jgi:hypothetical protein
MLRVTLAAIAVALAACTSTVSAGITPPGGAVTRSLDAVASPCTGVSGNSISHIIVVVEENRSEPIVRKKSMPFLRDLTNQCGLATNAHNLTHPSLGNYIGLLSGQVQGKAWSKDVLPAGSPQPHDNLFHQLDDAGMSWGVYAQSMPSNCYQVNSGTYYVRHTGAPYFDNINGRGGSADNSCLANDVPLGDPEAGPGNHLYNALYGVDGAELPAFSLVAPDVCHDLHGQRDTCSGTSLYGSADQFLQTWVPLITSSPDYLAGSVAVLIMWDEGRGPDEAPAEPCWAETIGGKEPGGKLSCWVATVVVSPGTAPGARSAVAYNHYDMLVAFETLLGLPVLPNAPASSGALNGTAQDFLTAFGLS